MSEFTRDEAMAFIEAMRLTVANRVGFQWLTEKLGGLESYVTALADENERLLGYIEHAGLRDDYDAYVAR